MNTRGRNSLPRGAEPMRPHIAYVVPNRHVVKATPSNVSSFKSHNNRSASSPINDTNMPQPNSQFPNNRTVQYQSILKGSQQPAPPPYPSHTLKPEMSNRNGGINCSCHGPCSHRRNNSTLPRERIIHPQNAATGELQREIKPNLAGWSPRDKYKVEKVSYLDSVV